MTNIPPNIPVLVPGKKFTGPVLPMELLWCLLVGGWLVICVAGFIPLLKYDKTPGDQSQSIRSWPAASGLKTVLGKYTLVAFLHPQCSCSRATIGELAVCMTHYGKLVTAYALFLKPKSREESWVKSDLFYSAAAIPGVNATLDSNGHEAQLFGSETSGQIFLFAPSGKLVFAGGITDSRGHFGDNAGLDSLSEHLSGNKSAPDEAAVFGCPLFTRAREGIHQ